MSDETPRPQNPSEHDPSAPDPAAPETKVLTTTYLDDPSQLPPNVRLVGQDEYGNYIYEEVPAGESGAAGTSTAGGDGAAFAAGSYGGGVVHPSAPHTSTPSPAPESQKEGANPAVIALSVLLVLLLLSMIALLAMVFIPKAPLNYVVGTATTTTEVTETATAPEEDADEEDADEDDDFADLVVRLPRGFTLSDPVSTGEDAVEGSSYRIVNPCVTAGRGVPCTSEDFAESIMEAYLDNGGLDGDMRFYAESPVTDDEYPVACERQNGGKVLCVSGRDGSAAIMIDYE